MFQHTGNSSEHKHFDGGDIVLLIFYVNSREHMFKGLYKFMSESPSCRVITFPCLVVIGLVQIKYLKFHITPQNYVTKGLYNFLSRSSSWYVTIKQSLVALGIV